MYRQVPFERLLRYAFRAASPKGFAKLTLDTLGIFCAAVWTWEHVFTIQMSEGPSMYPTFNVRGDGMLISRAQKYGKGIEVGDVVRFYHPSFLGVHGAKRVLGMPGDWVCRDLPLSKNVGGYVRREEEGEERADMIQVCTFCSLLGLGWLSRIWLIFYAVEGPTRSCLSCWR